MLFGTTLLLFSLFWLLSDCIFEQLQLFCVELGLGHHQCVFSGSGLPNPIPAVLWDTSPAPLPSSYAAYGTTDEYPNWLCVWRVDYVFIRHLYLYFVGLGFNLFLIPTLMCGWETSVFLPQQQWWESLRLYSKTKQSWIKPEKMGLVSIMDFVGVNTRHTF